MRLVATLVILALTACKGKGSDSAGTVAESDTDTDTDTDTDSDTDTDTDTDSDTDTDTDTDTDSDTDTDTDTDTDVDTGTAPIEGSLTYTWTIDGETLCDATIEFTGVPYAGTCTDCDFAFQVTGTLTRDDGNGACPYWAPGTIYNTAAVYVDPDLLAFASKTTGPYWGDAYTDAFMLGSYDDFGFGKPFGPNWWFKSGGGFYDYGTASYSGGKLEWTYTPDVDMAPLYRSTDDYHEPTCSHDWTSYAKGPYAPGYTQYDSLPCSEGYVDVWTFEGSAGGTANITVDTTSASPALDPAMWVYGPTDCIEKSATSNFGCTEGTNGCPSMSIDTDVGQYLLVVQQESNCGGSTGDPGDYRLDVDATWDPKLARIRDDFANTGKSVLEINGSATITK